MWFLEYLFFPKNIIYKKNNLKDKIIIFKLKDPTKIDPAPTYQHP